MSRLYFNTLLLIILLALSHVLVWQMDKGLHHARKDYRKEIEGKSYPYLRKERLQIEKIQKKSLKTWAKGKDGYIQMPINRAFDYYLRDLK
ncbi:hypothetical protein [Peredibacter starrii]|uniref:Uncharacterized protein n=1 Tax=Peredibacter starrii TaxID=28202 RepID=A0AAX4HRU5_9BACT|nr:hypothetical protein [Peredibacter starrii]WPU66066.1 hypothetical protein SOO65_04840 [Peredibacter starrii]